MLAQLPDNLLLRCIQKTEEYSFTRLRRTCKGFRDFVDNNVHNLRISCTDHITTTVKFVFGPEHEIRVETIDSREMTVSSQTVGTESLGGYYFYSVKLTNRFGNPWNEFEFAKRVPEIMKSVKSIRCRELEAPIQGLQPGALASVFRTIKFESFFSRNDPAVYNYPEVLKCNNFCFFILFPGYRSISTTNIIVEDGKTSDKVIPQIMDRSKSLEEFCTAIDNLAHLKIETDIVIDSHFPHYYEDAPQVVKWMVNWDLRRSISYDEWTFERDEYKKYVDLHLFQKKGPRKDMMVLFQSSTFRTDMYLSTVDLRSVQSIFKILNNIRPGGMTQRVVDFSCLHDKWIDYKEEDLFDRLFADFQAVWLM